jgi:hypothetical protein
LERKKAKGALGFSPDLIKFPKRKAQDFNPGIKLNDLPRSGLQEKAHRKTKHGEAFRGLVP